MSKDEKSKKEKLEQERTVDAFPEDMLPEWEPQEVDVLEASFGEIIEASGIRGIVHKMAVDPEQKAFMDVFLDGMIKKHAATFESLREQVKDGDVRRDLLKRIMLERKGNV